MRTRHGWIVTILAASFLTVACSSEEYFCNDEGCFYCDGFGCRDAEHSYARCEFGYECQDGEFCTTLGCVRSCTVDSDCPQGTVCQFQSEGGAGQCLCPTDDFPLTRPDQCSADAECGVEAFCATDGRCLDNDGANCDANHPCSGGRSCQDFICSDSSGGPEPDGGTGGPEPDGGTGGPEPDGGTGGPEPDGGTGGPGNDSGTGGPGNDGGTRPEPQCELNSQCEALHNTGWECLDGLCVLPCEFDFQCGPGCSCDDGYCTEPVPAG
jgi:hypothetical protein